MSGNERKLETKLCGGCVTIELNGKLRELVEKLIVRKQSKIVVVEKRETLVLFLRRENETKHGIISS